MASKTGRDSKYRTLIVRHVALKKDHPIHAGIEMQAHHLISAKGVQVSKIGDWLEKMSYNINLLPNLVLIPNTMQGACHLGVQPHKSGHTIPSDPHDPEGDDAHPISYHDIVAMRLTVLKRKISSTCFGNDQEAFKKVTEEMNLLSAKILQMIQNTPKFMRLSAVADYYQPGLAGCGGMDKIPARPAGRGADLVEYTEKHVCQVHRNHQMAQGKNQRQENITFKKPIPYYKLSVGN